MAVKMENRGGELVAHLSGELDHHTAQGMREAVDAAVERFMPRRLRLDFQGVSFMDSSGVGLVMGRYRLMNSMGGALLIEGASERIGRMMKLAGLDRLNIWEAEEAK